MATDLQGFTTQEVLNKVLNTTSESFKVDIVSGSEYAEDSGHTSADTGQFILGVRNDTLGALGGTDGDYVPFQMNASGALYVEIASGGSTDAVYVDDANWTDGSSKHMLVGGLYQSTPQSITDGDVGPFQVDADGALHISDGGNAITVDGTVTANLSSTDNTVLDNIDSNTDYGATTGGGTESGALRVTIANNSTGVLSVDDGGGALTVDGTVDLGSTATTHLSEIEGAVEAIEGAVSGSEMQVDVVAISAQSDGTYIGDIKFGESLPAGTNNIGDVDVLSIAAGDNNIGNVDIVSLPASTNTIEVVGDAAEDAAVAGNPVLSGGRHDSSVRTLDDGDVGALALDPTGALYTREFLGQAGSILVTGTTNAVTTSVSGTKFVAIQFLEDTTFDAGSEGLVASTAGLWPDDANASTTIDSNGGAVTGSEVFPQGMTIFGRWDGFKLDSGKVIAYLGYV